MTCIIDSGEMTRWNANSNKAHCPWSLVVQQKVTLNSCPVNFRTIWHLCEVHTRSIDAAIWGATCKLWVLSTKMISTFLFLWHYCMWGMWVWNVISSVSSPDVSWVWHRNLRKTAFSCCKLLCDISRKDKKKQTNHCMRFSLASLNETFLTVPYFCLWAKVYMELLSVVTTLL